MASRGFTLVEAMITLAVLAVLATLAAPSFDSLILRTRLISLGNDLMASAQLARSEALKRNAVVVLCASANGSTCSGSGGDWSAGWIVALESGGTVFSAHAGAAKGFRVIEDPSLAPEKTYRFQPNGEFWPTAEPKAKGQTLVICRSNPSGMLERVVTIGAVGSARAQTIGRDRDCS